MHCALDRYGVHTMDTDHVALCLVLSPDSMISNTKTTILVYSVMPQIDCPHFKWGKTQLASVKILLKYFIVRLKLSAELNPENMLGGKRTQYQKSLLLSNNVDKSHSYLQPSHLFDKCCSDQRWQLPSFFFQLFSFGQVMEMDTSSVQLVRVSGRGTSTTARSGKSVGLPTVADLKRSI